MRFKIRRISKFLLDTHLDFLDADISSKHFGYLQDVFKMFQRHVLKTSSRHVFKLPCRRLQRNIFRLPRRLEDALKTSLTDLQICLQDVCNTSPSRLCKTSSRRLGYLRRQKWLRWRCVADVFKTYLENDCKTSWRQTSASWLCSFGCFLTKEAK